MVFNNPDELEMILTPLGAATAEAMPDRNVVRHINSRFKTHRECPVSEVFTAEEVEAFYRKRGLAIKAVVLGGEARQE